MRYLIHAIKSRRWYVDGYLIPSMVRQGIPEESIAVWEDPGVGNLEACLRSFEHVQGIGDGYTWHIQDDVVLSRWFYAKTKIQYPGIVCGFCGYYDGEKEPGEVFPDDAWLSFQCIGIPDDLAGECAAWFRNFGQFEQEFLPLVYQKRGDDLVFQKFVQRFHPDCMCWNLSPNLVEHIDDLIGGSIVNFRRKKPLKSEYWDEPERVEELQEWLRNR